MSPSNTSQVGRIRNNTDIDWELCFLCQVNTSPLQCPSNNAVTKNSAVDTYKKLASNILKLVELDEVPLPLNEKLINEKADLGDFLLRNINNAKYHLNALKGVRRPVVKKENTDPTRSSRRLSVVETKTPLCFFCEKPEEKRKKLHEVRTFRLDAKVRRAAIDTGNTILNSKMQNGDTCA